jgi:hypothetical protein
VGIAALLQQLSDDTPPGKERRIWRQVGELVSERQRLALSEIRHRILAREMISVEEAVELVESIYRIVIDYVPNEHDRATITSKLEVLLNHR